mgnify:CR=1 FL=1
MKIFDLPPLLEAIAEEIAQTGEADPAKVNVLIEDGPVAIESWCDMIDSTKAEAEVIKTRINELKERMEARLHTAERMSNLLRDILDQSFEGKVKTPLITCWNQDSVTYDFDRVPKDYYVVPEPKVDKKRLIADYKAGILPKDIAVIENKSRSLRTRR